MRVSTVPLIVALSTAPLTAAQAGFAFFEKNATVDWFNDATFVQVPGQAVSQVANLGNTGLFRDGRGRQADFRPDRGCTAVERGQRLWNGHCRQ